MFLGDEQRPKTEKQTDEYGSVFFLSFIPLFVSFPSGIVASHSVHSFITVSCCVSGDLL